MNDYRLSGMTAERAEAIGRLTPGLLHDLNNLLTILITSIDLIEIQAGDVKGLTTTMREAINRAFTMNRQLMSYARRGEEMVPHRVDVGAAVAEMRGVLDMLVGRGIRTAYVLKTGCEVVIGRGAIDQLLLNLAANARDAMPYGGNLLVVVRDSRGGDGRRTVVLEVCDDGSGMTPDVRARAFEPFFTTRSQQGGTGLGLSIVRQIVEDAGGEIEVESEAGFGTTVRLTLPNAGVAPATGAAIADDDGQ
jgi:signal transduction histidine kinase